jgi:subtilase family serine protease
MHRLLAALAGAALVALALGPAGAAAGSGTGGTAATAAGSAIAATAAGAPPDPSAHPPLRVLPHTSTSPQGLSPAQIKAAYGFSTSSTVGAGTTIAIVDAYDDPTAENDLNVFSSTFGLPPCTTANGCFRKVNQNGGTSYPRKDAGWALEISLDVQWAHAIAPGARILLVEANSNRFSDLLAAEDYATSHATYVSNSWGASEFNGETAYDSHFNRAGVSIFVSSGDNGLGAEYPASSPYVIAVGGTTLTFDTNGNLVSETGWSGSGGGCSAYETANSAQSGFSQYGQVNCNGRRATPDVALDADPASGVSVYDSTRYQGQSGWWVVGGTSASAPMWAARSAVSGQVVNAAFVYGTAITYRDITVGNNGAPCLVGYDLVTGRGSWTGATPSRAW